MPVMRAEAAPPWPLYLNLVRRGVEGLPASEKHIASAVPLPTDDGQLCKRTPHEEANLFGFQQGDDFPFYIAAGN